MDFLREALRDPKNVGAVAPSSRKLAQMGVRYADLGNAKVVMELGPGGGAFTGEILAAMPEQARYLGIEINEAFVQVLQKEFPEAAFVHGSAGDIGRFLEEAGHDACDRIVSGIPWSNFAPEEQDAILGKIAAAMAPQGIFVTFAYYPFNHLPKGRVVKEALERHFASVRKSEIVLGNLPPAFVYVCRK